MDTLRVARLPLITALSVTVACQAADSATSPTPTPTATSSLASTSPARSAPASTAAPTPIVLSVSGHVTKTDGSAVPGVRLRFSPFYINDGRVAGPDVIVSSDANGAYSAKVSAWTLEALASSSSSQLSLFVTPPTGMKVVKVTGSSMFALGPLAPNDPQWYFMLDRDVHAPIDVVLAAQ